MRVTTWTLGMLLLIFGFTSPAQAIMVTEDSPVWVDFTLPIVAPFSLPASGFLSLGVYFSPLDSLINSCCGGWLNIGEGIEASAFDAFGNFLGSGRYVNGLNSSVTGCACADIPLNPHMTTASGHLIIRAINGSFNLADISVWVCFYGCVQSTLTFGRISQIVAIDIQADHLDLSSKRSVPVAILSSPRFDATQVDPVTVRLARLRLLGTSNKSSCEVTDADGDGLLDLVCPVKPSQLDMQPGESLAVLEAVTFSGERIRGAESITVVP